MSFGEPEVQLVRAGAPLLAFALGLVLERLATHEALRPAWRANLGLWLVDLVLMASLCGACAWVVARWAAANGIGLLSALGAPPALAVAASVVALDGVAYAWHRANHRVALLWRFHRVHHADDAFHVSTALRFHPGELLLSLPVRLAAIVSLGAPPAAVVIFEAVFGIANVLEHGNFDLPRRLERGLALVFITPALHRRHHSVVRRERDANFGTVLSAWDRLARTLLPSDSAARFPTGVPLDGGPARARSLTAMLLDPLRPRVG